MGAAGEADPVQHLLHRCAELRVRHAGDAQRQRDVVERGKVRHQPEILEHHADPPPEAGQARARQGDDVRIEQADRTPARPLGEVEQLEQRGLARTGCAGEEIEGAFVQREAQVRERLGARPIAQPDILELDNRGHRGAVFPRWWGAILPRPLIAAPCMAQAPGAGKAQCARRLARHARMVKAPLALGGNPVFMSIR